jgi:hypothetical protein
MNDNDKTEVNDAVQGTRWKSRLTQTSSYIHVLTSFEMRVRDSDPEFICQTSYYLLMIISICKALQNNFLSIKPLQLYLLTYGIGPFLRSCKLCSHSGTSQHFMQPEDSTSCSQEPSTGPYPDPDRSSPYHPILSL